VSSIIPTARELVPGFNFFLNELISVYLSSLARFHSAIFALFHNTRTRERERERKEREEREKRERKKRKRKRGRGEQKDTQPQNKTKTKSEQTKTATDFRSALPLRATSKRQIKQKIPIGTRPSLLRSRSRSRVLRDKPSRPLIAREGGEW